MIMLLFMILLFGVLLNCCIFSMRLQLTCFVAVHLVCQFDICDDVIVHFPKAMKDLNS